MTCHREQHARHGVLRRCRRSLAVLWVAALLATGCSDDGTGRAASRDPTTGTSTATDSSTSTATDTADDTGTDTDTSTSGAAADTADDTGTDTDTSTSGTAADSSTDADDTGAGVVAVDYGVDPAARVIRVGLNAELSGPFRWQSERVVEAHMVYWEWLNDRGGISGWTVEPIVRDNGYDTGRHLANYEAMSGQAEGAVVMFAMSAGTPMTLATTGLLVEDSMAALPLSFYSGWADPSIGSNVFEVLTSYCVESMNGVTYMAETYGKRGVVVSVPGAYGSDGAYGAKIAAEALGVDIVYDGEAAAVPSQDDMSGLAGSIAASDADWVWLATDPGTTARLLDAAIGLGFAGQWSGNGPSWSPWLLNLVSPEPGLPARFVVSTKTPLWDEDGSPGMREMIEAMRQYRPDALFDDVYVVGWILGYAATAILAEALSRADLTRAGVLDAAKQTKVDLKGLGPDIAWSADPDESVARATYLHDVSLTEAADLGVFEFGYSDAFPEAGPQAYYESLYTVSDEEASNGYSLIKGPYVSETARNWSYEPCRRPA